MNRVIVSRHPAAIEFIAIELGGRLNKETWCDRVHRNMPLEELSEDSGSVETIPVVASATADDVRGKVVYTDDPSTVPLEAAEVIVIVDMTFADIVATANEAVALVDDVNRNGVIDASGYDVRGYPIGGHLTADAMGCMASARHMLASVGVPWEETVI